MSRAVMQRALEDICGAKLCEINSMSSRVEMVRLMDSAITALRAALAEPEQEPCAMRYDFDGYGYKYIDSGSGSNWQTRIKDAEPLYTAPTPRRPLTDGEICAALGIDGSDDWTYTVARAIEAAHGIGEQHE